MGSARQGGPMHFPRRIALVLGLLIGAVTAEAQVPAALKVTPNLAGQLDQPLRYRPENGAFVIENGAEFFNRPLYGGTTAFRVDGGDKPEFVLYLPGRGGNLRFGLRTATTAKWLLDATKVVTSYLPGELRYEIRDPLLGAEGVLRLRVLAYAATEGVIVRAEAELGATAGPVDLVWAYGGINGERGKRDGDIGTENVPISQWFQFKPEFVADNSIETYEAPAPHFIVRSKAATIFGLTSLEAREGFGDAALWNDVSELLVSAGLIRPMERSPIDRSASAEKITSKPGPPWRVVVGQRALVSKQPLFLSLQRLATDGAAPEDLATYREVTAAQPGVDRRPPKSNLLPAFTAAELSQRFADAEQHFAALRSHVSIETPDAFINAAAGALNVAADAVWDEPQSAIMHGAIAWRTRLLGWRGPYSLTALGWQERAQKNLRYWSGRQNLSPVPPQLPPADAKDNLARSETALHSNGDMSNSHYDMNAVFIDGLFRHLQWTGDLEFAREMWPVIERHLAWERRLFRREFGPEKLPLYEAYAMIWASDDLGYHGGGAAHASAYNFYHNTQAARLARLLGKDAEMYEREAGLIRRAMRELLWIPDSAKGANDGHFAEFKDLLGRQLVHPSAALWSVYHTIDSEVTSPEEAWAMTRYVDRHLPHLPVRGPGVPDGAAGHVLASSNWMPYSWSINNVVMGENVHTALAYWQAGRSEEAFRLTKSSLLASMFMGICPGNVGSMNYLDVYRRESQRDFADGSGVLSRALVEGLFGVRPDALAGELKIAPGFPAAWEKASLRHPNVNLEFRRLAEVDTWIVEPRFPKPMALRVQLPALSKNAQVRVNGVVVQSLRIEAPEGAPRIEVVCPAAARSEISVTWSGLKWRSAADAVANAISVTTLSVLEERGTRFDPVSLSMHFNDRVTEIFRPGKYVSPRSPFVSLALPSQGIGAWAGHVNEMAEIDDRGLRAVAAKQDGKILLPNGVPLATPSAEGAKNILFTSQWDNYPREATVGLSGRARRAHLLMAGSTNFMQSRIDNGEVIVNYTDGTTARLGLENPTTWWPIDQDFFTDDYQFKIAGALPTRVDLKTGKVRVLGAESFKGRGGKVAGGAATVLELGLDPAKTLQSLTVRTLANEVVIGLMSVTLERE